jgi:hypothetical protein
MHGYKGHTERVSPAKLSRRAWSAKPTKYNTRECALYPEGFLLYKKYGGISYAIKKAAKPHLGNIVLLFLPLFI